MHTKLAAGGLLFAAAITTTSATIFPLMPLVLGVGTTSWVLTGTQVALSAAAIAGLAIAKSALLIALINDKGKGRKRREATQVDFSLLFEGIDKQDVVDCGKLLVCRSFAKPEDQQTSEDKAIVNLFDDLSVIQPNAYGKFQWAAYVGTFKDTNICRNKYSKCQIPGDALSNFIQIKY